MDVVRSPLDFNKRPMLPRQQQHQQHQQHQQQHQQDLEIVTPLPRPLTVPPVITMYFIFVPSSAIAFLAAAPRATEEKINKKTRENERVSGCMEAG
jgi:hypothetical protein